MHDSAKGKADALFTGDEIDDAVDSYAERTVDEFNATVNRYSAGMAEANAIHSSAFIIGMSLIERKRLDDIKQQESNFAEILEKGYMKADIKYPNE